jgi:hypothetical protein
MLWRSYLMEMIFLIKYKDDDTIEGYVDSIEDFDKWLVKHNNRRVKEGEIKESREEFEAMEVLKL